MAAQTNGDTQQSVKAMLNNKDGGKGDASKANKRLSVERIYQKKTQLEHILLRPDTYVGSIESQTTSMWVMNDEAGHMEMRELTYVPGLYKIFDEILVNAADNKQRDKNMDTIKIDIDPENGRIKIWNNGQGIPVVMHKDEKMYVPSLIFGHLLTSSNYDDDQKKVTGGRNGYGAKLCNIFSTKFTVETSEKASKKSFKQVWQNNMSKAGEPKIGDAKSADFTCITFEPDLTKFKMTSLDRDIVDLFRRRAYDIAASTRDVKVYLNGKRIPVRSFKDYVDLYLKDKTDDEGNPLKVVYEKANPRWEVAVALSTEKGFQQVSFTNSIATTKGGRHVDYIVDQITKKLCTVVSKKSGKSAVQVKPFQIKSNMWVFVNCQIENPSFDSQTKENMTLQAKKFGSTCDLSEKFMGGVSKSGIIEYIMNWMKFKGEALLNKKCSSTKQSKLRGVPKLDDANDAGTKNSSRCTLILTEGDSAKTLAVAGLSVVGRDHYGVFPLKGKLLNTRDATTSQILNNAEINNIIKILGLQYKTKYTDFSEVQRLRYGKVMIMADQDQDGSHIKGLLINFIHHSWPNLLKHNFLVEFITPIVKVSKNKRDQSFYSLPEFEEWKANTDGWHTWKIKYYKGLGTSTAKEAKEYFSNMALHKIPFRYAGAEDDAAIEMAFSKKHVEDRKKWLTDWMEQRKQRKELGLGEDHMYGKDTTRITYSQFINKELVLFSNLDNERSIPSMVDGFKPGQRKVIYTCLKRNLTKEVKVAQLAGSVAEISAYHHGENSLMSTIVGLAQDYVGSNNLNMLLPIGQFGTRLHGGADSASPRYIFTALHDLARLIIHPHDDAVLTYLNDDGAKIEPHWYCPVIPMVLVNGATGIGTAWSTTVPNHDVETIIKNVKHLLHNEPLEDMAPSYRGFRGQIDEDKSEDCGRYVCSGEVAILDENTIEITELPIGRWTQQYKDSVLEPMYLGTDKIQPVVSDYKEYHTDATVRFIIKMTPDNFRKAEAAGFHSFFKLQKNINTTNLVLYDAGGVLHKYESAVDILRDFYKTRLELYKSRKNYLDGMLDAEARKLSNQARFILEKIDGKIALENRKKADVIIMLTKMKFESDPIKGWKETQLKEGELDQIGEGEDAEIVVASRNRDHEPDYNYLVNMAIMSLSKEKKEELLKQRDAKMAELKLLRGKTVKDLWLEDLRALEEGIKQYEEKTAKENKASEEKNMANANKGRFKAPKNETQPSKYGTRIPPPLYKKQARSRAKKDDPKQNKLDSFLSRGDGDSPSPAPAKSNEKPKTKTAPKKASPSKKAPPRSPAKETAKSKRKERPWESDSSDEDDISSISSSGTDDDVAVVTKPKPTTKRAAALAAKSGKNESDDDMSSRQKDSSPPPAKRAANKAISSTDGSDDDILTQSPPKKAPAKKVVPTTKPAAKKPAAKKPAEKKAAAKKDPKQPTLTFGASKKKAAMISLDSSDDDSDFEVSNKTKASTGRKRKNLESGSESEDFQPKKKSTKAVKKTDESFAISDDEVNNSSVASRAVPPRAPKAKAKYNFSSDESDW